ncbi:MAG: hypothetical protein HRT58_06465 [Crocinitomicaceae bacterium]|nr:hypothetical protein [Flavobacteriales bacterium]NQZ35288.1 hypothetical protein [Crocinitomicaceae bacterium]
MSTLSYFHRVLLLMSLVLLISLSCRKDIDFNQSGNSYTTGAINPSQPILEAWEFVDLASPGIDHVASDGQMVYYSRFSGGMSRMFKMDTSGISTVLFDISVNDDVQLVEYEGAKLYFTQRESNGVGKIHEFDDNGIINTYELIVSPSYGTNLTSILDVGSELFVTGKFRFGNSGSSWSACLIDKATGAITEMPGLGSNPIKSATYFNNEIYVAAKAVKGNYSSSSGRAVAKWNGSQWESIGPYSFSYNYIGPLVGTCVGSHNGELFVGGRLDYSRATIEKYSPTYDNFINDQGFRGTITDLQYTNIQMRMIDNDLYAFGYVRFSNASFTSVYVINNGVWRSIGALDGIATDLAICQGVAFALVNGYLKKYPL